ncbi:SAM-dependent methyltransferase [Mycobacterium sp. NPDC050551]|uniref:SAM-dependent methyltransferase n=1 Tax=Mycobacterium sp. NPDC050551 TaxID=3155407 RepID=UPI00341A2DA7
MTAFGAAMIRAQESRRPDPLYADPWAQLFLDAAEPAYRGPTAPAGAAETWTRLQAMAEAMYEGRTIGVRLVDDDLTTWVAAGNRQIVLLGAGLDSHAFRLDWPGPARLFEVDLPPIFGFKEPVLAAAGATPVCERHLIAADLTASWAETLLAGGFRSDEPTCWIDHAIPFTPREAARSAAIVITELSAPGSTYSYPFMAARAVSANLQSVARPQSLQRDDAGVTGLGTGGRDLLESLGWTTDFEPFPETAARYGRALAADAESGTVRATRL